MKSSLKPYLSCSPARDLVAAVFPVLGPAALTQRATSILDKVRSLSAALTVRRKYLNLK
jgi:hypothetical protein